MRNLVGHEIFHDVPYFNCTLAAIDGYTELIFQLFESTRAILQCVFDLPVRDVVADTDNHVAFSV